MPSMIVLISGNQNIDFPSIVEAARVYPAAKRLGCDRIRVEKVDGARVAEYPLDAVRRFLTTYSLAVQPDRVARRDVDYEPRRPIFPGWKPTGLKGHDHGRE